MRTFLLFMLLWAGTATAALPVTLNPLSDTPELSWTTAPEQPSEEIVAYLVERDGAYVAGVNASDPLVYTPPDPLGCWSIVTVAVNWEQYINAFSESSNTICVTYCVTD
jgi:hypothetical protein